MTLTVSDRLSRLEKAVSELQLRVEMTPLLPLTAADAAIIEPLTKPTSTPSMTISTSEITTEEEKREQNNQSIAASQIEPQAESSTLRSEFWSRFRSGEFLLALLGIGLLLFGVAILFRYAVEQGWITPVVRMAIGYGIGSTLFGIGYQMQHKRPTFSQILTGGGIGAWYITAFAGYFSLDLISYSAALISMSLTTLTAFGVAVRRKNPIFAHIGLLGGLLTPFVLPVDTPSIPGLLAYTALIATVGMGIYFAFRWSAVLILAAVGSWLIYLVSLSGLSFDSASFFSVQPEQRWTFQLSALFNLIAFTLVPIIRTLIDLKYQNALTALEILERNDSEEGGGRIIPWYVHLSAIVSPFLVIALSADLWDWEPNMIGAVTLGLSALYAGISWGLQRWVGSNGRPLVHTHALVAALYIAWSISSFFEGDVEFILFSLLAVALMAIGTLWRKSPLSGLANLIYAVLALLYIVRLFEPVGEFAFFNGVALGNATYLASGFGILWLTKDQTTRQIYGLLLHFFVLGWFGREAHSYSQAAVTILWAIYAIALLVSGLVLDKSILRKIGLGTILLIAAKLFIVDLAEVETLVRTLLFIGFGASLLLVSYFFRSLWLAESSDVLEPQP